MVALRLVSIGHRGGALRLPGSRERRGCNGVRPWRATYASKHEEKEEEEEDGEEELRLKL